MKISEVAKMLGLPVETIRFYEKEGVVRPQRNDSSGYRDYDLWDVFKLVACITYRNMGMSVKEVAQFIRNGTREQLIRHISDEKKAIQREIEEKEYLRSALSQYEQKLKYVPYNIGNYWIINREALSYIAGVVRKGTEYSKRPEYWWREAIWLQKLPMVKNMQIVSVDALEKDLAYDEDLWCCVSVTDQMEWLGLEKNEYICELPETLCMVTVMDGGEIGNLNSDVYRKFLQKVREKGYTPCGTITSELLVRCWEGKTYHRYFEVMIPIKERIEPQTEEMA